MKVRNLLLAGLAVAAMTACSNNDEIVDNSNPVIGEEANMRLLFSFNENGTTRATDVTTDDDRAGTELEYGATKITAVLDYSDGRPRVVMPELTLQKDEGSQVAVATTKEFTVTAGSNVKLYAFINPTGLNITQNTDLDELVVGEHTEFTGATLAYIDNTVAENGNFLMSGEANIETIKAGETVIAKIDVNRVAAKLEEKTSAEKLFEIKDPNLVFEGDLADTKLGVKILNHSYSNLATNSYVLPQDKTFESFLQPYIAKNNTASDDSYRWNETGATYCLENSSANNPTRVHYKAKVYFGTEEAKETFYIRAMYTGNVDGTYENRVYKNWEALKEAYPTTKWEDSKKNDDEYLKANGIKKYDTGVCYYEASILHATKGEKIVRNNWYELSVSQVSKLGTPTPVEEPDEVKTRLVIKASIQPWKVQINNIKL